MNEVSSVKKEDFFRWLILLSGLLLYLVWEYELGCRIVDKTLEKIENKIKKKIDHRQYRMCSSCGFKELKWSY